MLCRILLALNMLAIVSAARAQEAITLDNFRNRLTTLPPMDEVDVGPFDCMPDVRRPAFAVCVSKVRLRKLPGAGANLLVRGYSGSRLLTSVELMMVNPANMQQRERGGPTVLYIVLASGLVATLSLEMKGGVLDLLNALQANAGRKPNERRVGQWVYRLEADLLLAFSAERK